MLKLGKEAAKPRGRETTKLAFVVKGNRRKLQVAVTFVAALLVIAATACGKFFPDAGTLVAITISPNNPTIQPSKTQQFTATGTFGDSSTKDISSTVTWSSSSASIATINSSGLATAGTSVGSTTITAKSGNQTASTTLTVSNQTSNGLTIACALCTPLGSGAFTVSSSAGSVTFTATDSNGQAVTPTWTSSNVAIPIGSSTGTATFSIAATGQTTTITATASSATGSATLTIQ